MTPAQFDAIAKLISLRLGPARDAARLVLVDGLRQADAMRVAGCSRDSVWATVRRVTVAAELCRLAAACDSQDLCEHFSTWLEKQTFAFGVFKVPKDRLEAVAAAIVAAGGLVLLFGGVR